MKVTDIKELLTKRKLKTTGLKNELVQRLIQSYKSTEEQLGDDGVEAPDGFPATAR